MKKPNFLLYFLVYILVYPFLKIFFRLKVSRRCKIPKGAFIVISNHASFMDFLIVMLSIYPRRRLNAITARKFYLYKPLHKLLPFMGCIPKSLFDPDVRSVKETMSVLKRGGGILMFPEGRCSTDGEYAGINKSTGKLIGKLGVPVISCRIEGSYNCMPLWRKGFRFGRLRLTISELFTAQESKNLHTDEINGRIDGRLGGHDDNSKTEQKNLGIFRAKRLAEGLVGVLYYCPACKREFTLTAVGNIIECTSCGNSAELDRTNMPVVARNWFKAQVEYEITQINQAFAAEVAVSLRMPCLPGQGLAEVGHGRLRLDPTGWRFAGILNGEAVELFFPLSAVPAVPFDPCDNFQIYSGGNFYVFTPQDNIAACVKYAILGEYVYRRFAVPMQMTGGKDMNNTFIH